MDTLDREAWSPHDQLAIFAFPLPIHTPYPVTLCHQVGPCVSSLLVHSPLPLSISLPSKSSHIVTWTVSVLRILTLLRSLRCSSTSIIHQAGKGATRLGLRQLSTCLSPGVVPGAKSLQTFTYIYVYASSDSTAVYTEYLMRWRNRFKLGELGESRFASF